MSINTAISYVLKPQFSGRGHSGKVVFAITYILLFWWNTNAQELSFMRLNNSNGLSDNKVNMARLDKDGVLWIGTANGLNSYDGYTVKKYFKEQHPEMGSNNIVNILIDEENRLWITFPGGQVCMLDENRNFNKVGLSNKSMTVEFFPVQTIKSGILFKSGHSLYKLKNAEKVLFEKVEWKENVSIAHPFTKWSKWDSSHIAFIGGDRLIIFDAVNLEVNIDLHIPGIAGADRLNDNEALITTEVDGPLYKMNLVQNKIIRDYGNLKDQFGEIINHSLRGISRLADGRFAISSGYAGVYIFDPLTEKLQRYRHSALDNNSVSSDNTLYTITDPTGYFFVTTTTAGLNYANIKKSLAGYQYAFNDATTGKLFDGFVNAIAEDKTGGLWLGTQNRLIKWDKENNKAEFFNYGDANGVNLDGNENIRSLCFDKAGKLWVGTTRFGITLMDKNHQVTRRINMGDNNSLQAAPPAVEQIVPSGYDDDMWIATSSGVRVFNIDGVDKTADEKNSFLDTLQQQYCFALWFRNANEIWAGTQEGAFRYRFKENKLDHFHTGNGLPGDHVLSFISDKNENVYVGTANGLSKISPAGAINNYQVKDGLRYNQCESLIADKQGNIWIANSYCILKFDPASESFNVYDESWGLSNSGFKKMAALVRENGEFLFGSNKGINYFNPETFQPLQEKLKVMITSSMAGNRNLFCIRPEKHELPFQNNTLLFTFSAIDLYASRNIRYQYRLADADKDWVTTTTPGQVIYNRLAPGDYIFEVRASRNGSDWVNASNPIAVTILTPWWRSTWFMITLASCLTYAIVYNVNRRTRKIRRQKEALEIEQAINWFATSMNEKNTVEDILWDVSRNCIRHLKFEDCVIYLVDPDRQVLVQKAAWGPKTTLENKIVNPIEIPFGRGITGSVAQSGIAEIINNTAGDTRYIVDDATRLSEICVPMISDGNVLGVIDSEHSRKNFFTQKHLSVLSAIASFCAVKIVRSIAEEEKILAQKELQHFEKRATETEMLALRAQMNPHFMFNSLNSINNFILKNDTEKASDYLTRFSQLMRMILENSRQDWVLLENELKALQLYIELEAVRLKNFFSYRLTIDKNVEPLSEQVPPMLIQPYVENAIWHGLLHRQEAGGLLLIAIKRNDGSLDISIEDNGIGRAEAALMKSKFKSHKKSYGLQITAERISIINKTYPVHVSVSIDDLSADPKITGTVVQLKIRKNGNIVNTGS